MQSEAHSIVAGGALGARLATQRSVEMRYLGQGHEISIALPARKLRASDAAALRATYEARYERQFGLRIADVPVEFLTWSVNVASVVKDARGRRAIKKEIKASADGKRRVFDPVSGKHELLPAYLRAQLARGMRLDGPALVAEPQTTTLVPRGWRCRVTPTGHLFLEKKK